jgi:hypothetical protein
VLVWEFESCEMAFEQCGSRLAQNTVRKLIYDLDDKAVGNCRRVKDVVLFIINESFFVMR